MVKFRDANPGLVKNYPEVWPLLAPDPRNEDGTIDFGAITRQLDDGDRKTISYEERLQLAEYRMGEFVYNRYKDQLGASPTEEQQVWLNTKVRPEVAKRFPGWAMTGGGAPSFLDKRASDRDYVIAQLSEAVADPAIGDTPKAKAIAAYLYFRDQAIASVGGADNSKPSASLESAGAANARAWLRGTVANSILRKYPEFAPIWASFFRSETVDPNG
jgi:hypothetical protein